MRLFRGILDAFFLIMIFEGAIRKWVAPGIGVPLQVFRDILPLTALIFVVMERVPLPKLPLPINFFLACYIIVGLLQCFNPSSASWLVALLGVRTHFSYICLALLFPLYLNSEISAHRRALIWALLSIPVMTLAAFQTLLPPDHWLNVYASGEGSGASFGSENLVRATGTFAYITGMQVYSQFTVGLCWAILLNRKVRQPRVAFWLYSVAFAAAIIGCLATGSRGAVFGAVFVIVLVTAVMVYRQGLSSKPLWLVTIGTLGLIYVGSTQLEAFVERTQSVSDDAGERIVSQYLEGLIVAYEEPFGFGIGMAHQQAGAISGKELGFGLGYENELTRAGQELGLPGLLSLLFLKVGFAIFASRQLLVVRSDLSGIAAFAFCTILLGFSAGIYTPIANALYWASIGIALWVAGRPRFTTYSVGLRNRDSLRSRPSNAAGSSLRRY